MFADDIVVLTPDKPKLQRLMHQVEVQANKWEMSIGANKCSIIVFGEDFDPHSNTSQTLQG